MMKINSKIRILYAACKAFKCVEKTAIVSQTAKISKLIVNKIPLIKRRGSINQEIRNASNESDRKSDK